MRIWIIRIVVAACAFVTGLAVVALTRLSHPHREPPPAFAQVCVSPAPSYCELVKNADCYNGQIVRVRAKLDFGDHGIFFYDDACVTGQIRTAGRLESISGEDFHRMLGKVCNGPCDGPLEMVVSGRFEKVIPSGRSDLLWDNIPLHLRILRMDNVSKAR